MASAGQLLYPQGQQSVNLRRSEDCVFGECTFVKDTEVRPFVISDTINSWVETREMVYRFVCILNIALNSHDFESA